LIKLKLSTKTNGIVYKDLSEEKVIELIRANVGTSGPRKITVEWGIDDEESAVVKPTEATDSILLAKLDNDIPVNAPKKENVPDQLHNLTETQQSSLSNSFVLSEIGKIDKFDLTTTKYVPLESNLYFAETADGRLSIKYAGTKIFTIWEDIVKLEQFLPNPIPPGMALLKDKDVGNRRTAITKFINKMRTKDIKEGDGVKLFNHIFKDQSKLDADKGKNGVDLDADFRPTGVGSSVYPPASPAGQDFGDG